MEYFTIEHPLLEELHYGDVLCK